MSKVFVKALFIAALMLVPGSIVVSASTAERYGLQPCFPARPEDACRLSLSINGETHELYLTGLLEPSDDLARRAVQP